MNYQKIFTGDSGIYREINNKIKSLTLKQKNVFFFDAFNVICPSKSCNYSIEEKSLFSDADHLSMFASKKLIGPALLDFINKNFLIKY